MNKLHKPLLHHDHSNTTKQTTLQSCRLLHSPELFEALRFLMMTQTTIVVVMTSAVPVPTDTPAKPPKKNKGKVENADVQKPKYGNGSTEVRRKPPIGV